MSSLRTQSSSSNYADEIENTDEQAVFSTTVHNLIVVINGGAIGLLQVTNQSNMASTHGQAHILLFCIFILIYVILRVYEVKLTRNQDPIHHSVAQISHLFGALASIMLICLISPIFTLIVAPLWLIWFFVVTYVSLPELIRMQINHQENEHQLSQA